MLYAIYALAITNIALTGYILLLTNNYSRERRDLLNRIMARDYQEYWAKKQPVPAQPRNFITYYQNNPQANPFTKKKLKNPPYMPDNIDNETEDKAGE